MSIQNVLTAALFKRDEQGRTVMYPNGVIGRGYVVPDAATEHKMRRTLMWLVLGSGLFGGIGIQVMMFIFGSMGDVGILDTVANHIRFTRWVRHHLSQHPGNRLAQE